MNYQYNYPYNAPQNLVKPKYRAPVFTKIFAIICAVICTFWLLRTFPYDLRGVSLEILTCMAYMVCLSACVMMIVSLFTGKGLLFAISSFLLALYNIAYILYYVDLYTTYFGISLPPFSTYIFYLLEAILLILIGLHFILKGKGLNSTAKMIFSICYASLELIRFLINFISIMDVVDYIGSPALNLILMFLSLIFSVFVTLILIFFNPYKKQKQPKIPYYNNYNNYNQYNGPYNNGQYNGQV